MPEFGVSQEVATLGLSIFVVGLALGPLLLAPLSEACTCSNGGFLRNINDLAVLRPPLYLPWGFRYDLHLDHTLCCCPKYPDHNHCEIFRRLCRECFPERSWWNGGGHVLQV